MNGWINETRSKAPDRWVIQLDLGPKLTKTGKRGRKQKWITFRGTKTEAKKKLRDLIGQGDRGEFIEPSKRTVGEWLEKWLEKVKARHSSRTYETYRNAVQTHMLKSDLAAIRLQQLTASDVETYHHSKAKELSNATLRLHHAVLTSALKLAKRDKLVRDNPARDATERPGRTHEDQSLNVWTADEARKVLVAAKQSGTQTAAFFALALDSGARKGELQGLRWTDVDLTTGALRIERQLLEGGTDPVFGPTKTRKARTLNLSAETLALLREHKREQAELKLANRLHYTDLGLIFAQRWEHLRGNHATIGSPLSSGMIARSLDRLVVAAAVRRISVHGLRHTSATLMLAAGVQPHVVQRRLGHSSITTTLNLYAHVLPAQQQDAASRLAGLLYR